MKRTIVSLLLTLLIMAGIPLSIYFFGIKAVFTVLIVLIAACVFVMLGIVVYIKIYEALEDLFQ